MANFDREIDHYEVIVKNSRGILYAEKEFFTEDEAVEYAKNAFNCGYTVTVREINNVVWWN